MALMLSKPIKVRDECSNARDTLRALLSDVSDWYKKSQKARDEY